MSKVLIRGFRLEDFNQILILDQQTYCEEMQFKKEQLVQVLSHADVISYVIETEKKQFIGNFILKLEKFKNEMFIISLIIDAVFRKSGIGSFMMESIIEISKKLNINTLSTQIESKNQGSIIFLEKQSFEIKKQLSDFYYKDNKGLEFRKVIT